MLSVRRVIVGACGTPGSLRALRFGLDLAVSQDAALVPVHAWLPPGGDIADRRQPSPILRRVWADAAERRLLDALDTAWGSWPELVAVRPVLIRGETGRALVQVADGDGDVLVLGAGRRGALARFAGHGLICRYCLANARCPVVAVPPAELAQSGRHLFGHGMHGGVHRSLTVDELAGGPG